MLFSKTLSTKIKKVYVNKYNEKENLLVKVITYRLLGLPILTVEKDIN